MVILRILGRTEEPVTAVDFWHNLAGAIGYPLVMIALAETAQFMEIAINLFDLMIVFGIAASFVQIGFYFCLSTW